MSDNKNDSKYSIKADYWKYKNMADKGRDANGRVLSTTERIKAGNKAIALHSKLDHYKKTGNWLPESSFSATGQFVGEVKRGKDKKQDGMIRHNYTKEQLRDMLKDNLDDMWKL